MKLLPIPNINSRPRDELEAEFAATQKVIGIYRDLGLKMTRHLQGKDVMTQDDYELGCSIYYHWVGWQEALVQVEKNRKTESDPTASSDSVIVMPKTKKLIQ